MRRVSFKYNGLTYGLIEDGELYIEVLIRQGFDLDKVSDLVINNMTAMETIVQLNSETKLKSFLNKSIEEKVEHYIRIGRIKQKI